MDIGVLLPTGTAQWGAADDPRELIAFGRYAECSGFSSLFANDSLISPRIEALTMLAALAPVTETVTLGTAALMPFLRRPIQAAQSLASIDLLSGDRLAVTVGAGFPGRFERPLCTLSELPWERRFARYRATAQTIHSIACTTTPPGARPTETPQATSAGPMTPTTAQPASTATNSPRIVMAHSLGSAVAYEALHAHPELRPELFLTLGSPLALPRAVFHRLCPTPGA